jgi:hypothetical protein
MAPIGPLHSPDIARDLSYIDHSGPMLPGQNKPHQYSRMVPSEAEIARSGFQLLAPSHLGRYSTPSSVGALWPGRPGPDVEIEYCSG